MALWADSVPQTQAFKHRPSNTGLQTQASTGGRPIPRGRRFIRGDLGINGAEKGRSSTPCRSAPPRSFGLRLDLPVASKLLTPSGIRLAVEDEVVDSKRVTPARRRDADEPLDGGHLGRLSGTEQGQRVAGGHGPPGPADPVEAPVAPRASSSRADSGVRALRGRIHRGYQQALSGCPNAGCSNARWPMADGAVECPYTTLIPAG